MVINGIGKRLEYIKDKKNWTYEQLADELGLTRRSVYSLMKSDSVANLDTLQHISKVTGDIFTINGKGMTQINTLNGDSNIQSNVQMNGDSIEYVKILEEKVKLLNEKIAVLENSLKDKDFIISLLKNKT